MKRYASFLTNGDSRSHVRGVGRGIVGERIQIGRGLIELRIIDLVLVAVAARAERQSGDAAKRKNKLFHRVETSRDGIFRVLHNSIGTPVSSGIA